jgi:hypothetical protein
VIHHRRDGEDAAQPVVQTFLRRGLLGLRVCSIRRQYADRSSGERQACDHAGQILNPLLAKSQYVGGMIGGIGMAIHELTMTDRATGPILGDTLANYLIPVHADIPEFDIAMIDEDDPHLPGSVKGFGMLGTAGIQAAIANAVFRQSGRECGACRSGLKI